eukprot:1160435-Pelagomonas_calceolata.AAC.13
MTTYNVLLLGEVRSPSRAVCRLASQLWALEGQLTGVPCIKDGVIAHILNKFLASEISLAKPRSQVGFRFFKWTLAALFQTAFVGPRFLEGEQFPGWARIGEMLQNRNKTQNFAKTIIFNTHPINPQTDIKLTGSCEFWIQKFDLVKHNPNPLPNSPPDTAAQTPPLTVSPALILPEAYESRVACIYNTDGKYVGIITPQIQPSRSSSALFLAFS